LGAFGHTNSGVAVKVDVGLGAGVQLSGVHVVDAPGNGDSINPGSIVAVTTLTVSTFPDSTFMKRSATVQAVITKANNSRNIIFIIYSIRPFSLRINNLVSVFGILK